MDIENNNNSKKVGFIYDNRMLLHKLSKLPVHPECPERIEKIIENLKKCGLWSELLIIDKVEPIQKEILSMVHRESYVDLVESIWPEGCERENMILNGCYYNKYTGESAFLSSGAVIQSIDLLQSKQWNTAFCCVRPPGHHSGASQQCSGFCFFNNVVVGAKYLREKYKLNKIAIFDFDVHHGDGTQALTYEDHQTLFISIHQYDEGTFYPYKSGDLNKTGDGFNINIGWNTSPFQSAGDDEYISAFETIVMPALKEFEPEFIFISAGFDSAVNDKLGRCQLTKFGYEYMSSRLVKNFPNILFVLEGGYNLDSIQWASEAVVRRILHPLQENELQKQRELILPNEMSQKAIKNCQSVHQKYWKLQSDCNIEGIIERNCSYGKHILSGFGQKYQINPENNKLEYALNQEEMLLLQKEEYKNLFWNGTFRQLTNEQNILEIANCFDFGLEIELTGEESYQIKGFKSKGIENRFMEVLDQTKEYQNKLLQHFSQLLHKDNGNLIQQIDVDLRKIKQIPQNSSLIIDGSNNQLIISHISDSKHMIDVAFICHHLLSFFDVSEEQDK